MLDRPNRSTRKTRRGAAAVELALMLLFLPFLALIIVDFARFAYGYITVSNCARNGAIWASSTTTVQEQHPQYDAGNTVTQNLQAIGQIDASTLSSYPTLDTPTYSDTYNGTYTTTKSSSSAYVKVTVHWTFTTIGTYPWIPSSMDLYRTVIMRLIPG